MVVLAGSGVFNTRPQAPVEIERAAEPARLMQSLVTAELGAGEAGLGCGWSRGNRQKLLELPPVEYASLTYPDIPTLLEQISR